MDEFAVAAYLGRTALAGAVVLALGRAALTVARAPATRQRLAAWTLRAAVLVPLLALLPSWWAITVPAAPAVAVAAEPVASPAEPATVPAEWPPEFVEVEGPAFDEVEPAPVPTEPEPVAVAALWPRGWRDAVAVAAAVYAAGVAYFLGVFALGHLALVRLRRGATAAPNRVQAMWGSRRPALLVHDALASPVCFGVVLPAVVLPSGLARSATAGQLAWVLAHEADHLRRGDPLTGWFAGLAKALFFFAPWFWGVRRELRLAQEYLADAAALAAGGPAADYAEFLVDLTAAPARGRRTLLAHGVRAGRSDLSRRITMVLSTTPPRAPRRWAAPAATGLLAAAVALSGVTIVRADEPPKRPAAPQPPEPPQPPESKPARVVEIRRGDTPGRRIDASAERLDVNKLRKQIDEALAAGKTDEAKKLVDALVLAFAPMMPEAPRPPAAPQPPAADRRLSLAIVSADARVRDALAAMQKALEATKDPEARAAMERAFKLLRDMPQERVPMMGGVLLDPLRDGVRATLTDDFGTSTHDRFGPRLLGVGLFGVTVAPLPEALAEQLQLPAGVGVVVTEVRPDSTFAKAGIKKNDILTAVGSVALTGGGAQLRLELQKAKSGKVAVTVITKGVKRSVEVELPQPREVLTRPAARKVQFESMKMEVFNGGVSIEASVGDMRYKITGAQVGEQLDNAVITITDGKSGKATTQAGTVLDQMGEKDRAAVQTLLDQVRGR